MTDTVGLGRKVIFRFPVSGLIVRILKTGYPASGWISIIHSQFKSFVPNLEVLLPIWKICLNFKSFNPFQKFHLFLVLKFFFQFGRFVPNFKCRSKFGSFVPNFESLDPFQKFPLFLVLKFCSPF